jgi:caffeoyl-CoA O-methyltransferase
MDRFIDSAVEQFAQDHTEPETDLYARLREETYRTMQSPEMQVGLIEGRFLQMLVLLWIWFLSMPTRPTTQTIMRHVFPW